MYEFLETIKENAELSKRELILGITCGFLAGIILGILIGRKPPKDSKASKRCCKTEVIIPREECAPIKLNPEDYD